MHGAGHLERRAHGEAQRLDAVRIGKAETQHGADLARGRKHLDGDLGHHRERAPGAGKRAAEIVAGDVLHHPAARPDRLAAAVDRLHAEHMIAHRAGEDAPAAGEIGGDHPADGALPPPEAEHRPEIDGLERHFLIVLGQRLLDLADRRAGPGHQHELARLIELNAGEVLGAQHRAILHRAPHLALGAAPHHLERRARVGGLGHEIGKLLDGIGSVEADTHMSGHCGPAPLPAETPCRD